jgi:CcmD family protein
MKAGVAFVLASVLLLAGNLVAVAQSGDRVLDGVVAAVTADSAGALTGFRLLRSDGSVVDLRVQGGAEPTRYGLENQAGDRWTSDQAAEPVEAARRVRDHQERFAPVTVTERGGVALTVVEKESGRLETNLNYLFAIYTVTWAAFFGYVFFLSRRQRDLQREIARLRQSVMDRVKQ